MKRPVAFSAFPRALATALQWKLLLSWFLITLVPTLLVTRPLHAMLAALLDHSVHADAWAKGLNGLAMGDVLIDIGRHGMPALSALFMLGLVLTLMLSPFLTGMSVTAVRARQRPGFGELMHGGLREYWRLLRYLLWALALYGLVAVIGAVMSRMVSGYAETAVLESAVNLRKHVADGVLIAVFVVAQCMIEAGRGHITVEPNQRSATRAFFKGMRTVLRRPLVSLGMFLGVSLVGYLLSVLLGIWRLHVLAYGTTGLLMAFVVLLLLVVSMAWMRTARLAGMAAVAETMSR